MDAQVHSCQRWNYREIVWDRSSEMEFLQSGFVGLLLVLQDDSNEKTCKLVCLVFFPSLIQKRRIFSVVRY